MQNLHQLSAKHRHPFLQGVDDIMRTHLGLKGDVALPITIPHGIDFYHEHDVSAIHSTEPIYLGMNNDFVQSAMRHKAVLPFPHPWLFLLHDHVPEGSGTLFVAPPPSAENFETMLDRIRAGNYEKPWGVLVKERDARRQDFDWWQSRGFLTHSAGSAVDKAHFYKLRDILLPYRSVASPYMSSVVIFAVAMGKRGVAIPDAGITYVDVGDWGEQLRLDSPEVPEVWRNLLSEDPVVARRQAEGLLGMDYWAEPAVLRERLERAIESVAATPLHLHPLKPGGLLYRFCLVTARMGVPIQRLFPNPLKKLWHRFGGKARLHHLTVVSGSDFAHYGVAGARMPLSVRRVFAFQLGWTAEAGHSVRSMARPKLRDETSSAHLK